MSIFKSRNFYWIVLLVLPALISGSGCKRKDTQQVPTGKVQKGTFYIDLHEEGELEAVNSTNISSPVISWRYGSLKISEMVKDGQEVKKGDTLFVFDQSEVQKAIVEAEGRLEISLAEMERMKAQHASELEELNADYQVNRISQEISRIRFEQAEYESEIAKKEIQLNLEKADIALDRTKEQIENRKKIQAEEIKQKNLSIDQDRKMLQEGHETMNKMVVTSPSSGIAIISHNWQTGNKFQIGDQCWAGFPLIQLPDLSSLKATVNINEVDIAKVTGGLDVEVRPDAFSQEVFTGKVHSVANLAINKQGSTKIKVFPVEVYINETHENLSPGLTVSCRIIVDKIDDVLYIPLDALRSEGDITYVYKQSGGGYERTVVEARQNNSDYVVITGGLDEGDTIALVDPFAMEEEEAEQENETSNGV